MILSDVSPLRTCADFLVLAKGLDHAFGNMTVCVESIIKKSRRRKCYGCDLNSNLVSRNSGEMHSSHVYRGMVSQKKAGSITASLNRSYAS